MRLFRDKLDAMWADLASADAAVAFRAMLTLARRPTEAGAFLQQRLQPVPPADPKRVASLLKNLGSDRYAERVRAVRELEQLAELVELDLHKALAANPTLEVRRRLEQIVNTLNERRDPITSLQALQGLRAVEVLEYIRTPAALAVLTRVAQGAGGARVTQDAKEALERLKKIELVRKRVLDRGKAPAEIDVSPTRQRGSSGEALPSGATLRLGATAERRLMDYITFSPEGDTLAVAGEDIRLWSVHTGKLLCQVRPKANPLAMTLAAGGKLMVASVARSGYQSATWFFQTWDVRKPAEPRIVSFESPGYPPTVAAMSADGKLFSAGSYDAVTIWYPAFADDINRPELQGMVAMRRLKLGGRNVARSVDDFLAMSPDGSLVAGCAISCSRNGRQDN